MVIRLAIIAAAASTVFAFGAGPAFAAADPFATTTQLQVNPPSSSLGDPVTLTATVIGTGLTGLGAPVGKVTFFYGVGTTSVGSATLVPNLGSSTTSTAALVTSDLPSGTYALQAAYGPDPNHFNGETSTSPPVQVAISAGAVKRDTLTTLGADTVDAVTGDPVTLTAHVTEAGGATVPTGLVEFDDTGNGNGAPVQIGSPAPLDANGNATLTILDFAAGPHQIIASYLGSLTDNGSHATLDLSIHDLVDQRLVTTITAHATPSVITTDDSVLLTAHIDQVGTPHPFVGDDRVTFTANGVHLNEALLSPGGDAQLTVGGWITGTYKIEAQYTGNIFTKGSSSVPVTLTVLPQRVSSTLAYTGATSADFGDTTTVSASLLDSHASPLPNRTVTFTLGSQSCIAVTGPDGTASCPIHIAQDPATYPLGASVARDDSTEATSTSGSFTVKQEATSISATFARTSSTTTLSATLLDDEGSPVSGRSVLLGLGGQTCAATTDSSGAAGCPVASALGNGTASLSASFAGDVDYFPAATSRQVQLVLTTHLTYNGASTADYDDVALLSATLTDGDSAPVAGRLVTFTLGTQSCQGLTDSAGVATCPLTLSEAPGAYSVTATYPSDATAAGSAATGLLTITHEQSTLAVGLTSHGSTQTLTGTLLEDGAAPIAGRTVALSLGGSSCLASTNDDGVATCDLPTPGVPSATLAASFAGDAFYLGANDSKAVTLQVPTYLSYTGATTGDFDDIATLSATLRDGSGALAGRSLSLTLGTQNCSATTNLSGTASCDVTVEQSAGPHPVIVSFAGSGSYLPSRASSTFTVTAEQTTITTAIAATTLDSSAISLAGTLREDGARPIPGRTVLLSLGPAMCTAVTDTNGVAACTVHGPIALGSTSASATFAGDSLYQPATANATTLLYDVAPGGGSFVVGDLSASGNVTFWGAQWAKVNALSGGVAPVAFKGFARTPGSPACGTTWSTDPGTSSPPPAGPLPAYLAVLVASSSAKSGSVVSGTTAHVVIVKTDAGYASDAGHAGTGTVVATVC